VTEVPRQIRAVLARAGLSLDDVDQYLIHQGSKFIVDQIAKGLSLPSERVPLRLAKYGNTVSSTLPMLLEEQLSGSRPRRMLLSGFGVGLSWATCLLLKHVDKSGDGS
jgi:3-oxoacyl-[acyl-carrier-protein] synthase-3